MDEPLVSVLTPVYNGEEFLRQCIESVLKQNYENWEYIIVNNCSTDRSLEIAQKYAGKEPRIKIHNNKTHIGHLENGNLAFQKISSDSMYCKMVHADDWLFPDCISKMVEIAEKYPTVGIVSSYRLDNKEVNLDGLPYPSHCVSGREIGKRFLMNREFYFGSPSSTMFRSSLVRKRDSIYNQTNIHSDVTACLDMLKESDFGFVHQVLTFTRRHDLSITSKMIVNKSTDMISRFIELLDYGPYYLSDNELETRLRETEKLFYIRLARIIYLSDERNIITKYRAELAALEVQFKYGKLVKSLIIEFFKIPIKNLFRLKISY
ncbi:MAG: glycosyltransferase [Bacteroidetes bacterium]|jgi:glycosyltransferase involved in cell wall biosynthesis|nr:glycosyltransferase [Bacteroidota bacterium]